MHECDTFNAKPIGIRVDDVDPSHAPIGRHQKNTSLTPLDVETDRKGKHAQRFHQNSQPKENHQNLCVTRGSCSDKVKTDQVGFVTYSTAYSVA